MLDKLDETKRKKMEFTSRNSSASQRRMQTIAILGIESSKKGSVAEDSFGRSDTDWEIYRGISREALSEEEDEQQQQLADLEESISAADPSFSLVTGFQPPTAEDFQIILSAERFRGIESAFSPSIFGVDQAGLIELVEAIIRRYEKDVQRQLLSNVFITGGLSQTANFMSRIETDLRCIADPSWPVVVQHTDTPMLDPWKGAALFCREEDLSNIWITKADYEEKGKEYLQEHPCSNCRTAKASESKETPIITTKRKKYL